MQTTTPEEQAALLEALGVEIPPTEDELPYSDGEPMESLWHVLQMYLLMDPLWLYWADRQDIFVGGNMFVYFSLDQTRGHTFRGPDVFVVKGTTRRLRKSWVVWQEGKGPDVIIELVSPTTARVDKVEKVQVYQDQLRVPEYFWFDPLTAEAAGFRLRGGAYEPVQPDALGRLASEELGLMLVIWEGDYGGQRTRWLRWAGPDGALLPTQAEHAAREQHRAAEALDQAVQEQRRAAEALDQAVQERERAEAAERRIAELEAEMARLRGGEGPERGSQHPGAGAD